MENKDIDIELTERWQNCLDFIRRQQIVSDEQFAAWLAPIVPLAFDGARFDVHVPSSYFHEHLEINYGHILFPAIRKFFGENVSLFYNYEIKKGDRSSNMSVRTDNPSVKVTISDRKAQDANPFVKSDDIEAIDSQLNPRYNFSNFLTGESNKLARSIGEAIAADPKCKTFNPLFIHGPSGVGKTHLMHAIGIGIKEQTPEAKVLYVTSRLFETQFVVAARSGKANDFMEFYRNIDCLLIDDIQDLVGKTKTQESFFHIFSHLKLNNRQIILSSDCAPDNMEGLPKRLLTRLKWGMNVTLNKPDLDLRLRVLRQKSMTEGVQLPEDVLQYIANNVTDSIRELEGVMVSILAHSTFLGEDISVDLVENILGTHTSQKKPTLNFDMITQKVSAYYNLDPDSLFTKDRRRELSDVRQLIMYLAKKHTDMKFKAIATRMARNHSTVMHACKNIEARLELEKQLRRDLQEIEESFRE